MKSAYLFIVASAAFVTCEPQRSNNDIIWFPVDNEDGVFVSIYGEKHRTPSVSKWRSHRRVRYANMEDYASYFPPPDNDDPSFFHNIHERRPYRRQNGFQQYPPAVSQNGRPFYNSQQNQKLVSFDDNRVPQRPDYQGFNDDNLQEIIDDVFNTNTNPSANQFPERRPIPQNRPTGSQIFTTTTTRRPFQRPTTNEWFVNPNPSQRPGIVRPNRPNRPIRPNRPGSEQLVFPGETASVAPTTATSTAATPTDLVPTETTTLTPCERMCPVTLEFNPVCGTDSFTYTNLSRLKCAKACGKEIALSHFGNCGRGRTRSPPPQRLTLLKTLGF